MGGFPSFVRSRSFTIRYPNLGDYWVAICHLIRFQRLAHRKHFLTIPAPTGPAFTSIAERKDLILEIARILGVESEIAFSNRPPEMSLPVHPARNGATLYIPGSAHTKRHWIAWQFDGVSHPELNPEKKQLEAILDLFPKEILRRVGKPLSLRESTEILMHSKYFIGVSSGMSHVAASAEVPSYIFLNPRLSKRDQLDVYRHLRRWNPYPGVRFFSTRQDLEATIAL